MEQVQRGLLAAGAVLFVVGMTITLGPATGFLDGASADGVDAGNVAPTHVPDGGDSTTETPTPTPERAANDDSGDQTADPGAGDAGRTEDDGSLVDADVDLDGDSGDDAEDADVEDDREGPGNGAERRDRGNGEKRGHNDDEGESTDSLVAPLESVLG